MRGVLFLSLIALAGCAESVPVSPEQQYLNSQRAFAAAALFSANRLPQPVAPTPIYPQPVRCMPNYIGGFVCQ